MQLHSCHMFLWHLYREPLFAGHPICHKLKDALDVSRQSYITDYIYLDQFQYCHVNKMLHMEKKKIPLAMACSLCYFWAWVLFPSLSLRHSIHGTQVPACHQLPEEKICSMWFHMIAVCLPAVFICLIFSDREEKCRGQHIYIRIGMISRYICMYLNT